MARGPDDPFPANAPAYRGPLHLQPFLTECSKVLAHVLRGAVQHPLSSITSISCACRPSTALRQVEEDEKSDDPRRRRSASARKQALQQHRVRRINPASTSRLQAVRPDGRSETEAERREACRLFTIEINEEAGVLRAFCRRCHKLFVVWDRALFWGLPRDAMKPPETYPYRCRCGGHTFELGLGFQYPNEPLDENDIETIAIAVRCAACEECAMILDEEAT